MVIVILCIYCAIFFSNNKLFPARKRLTLRTCAVDSFHHQHFWNGSDFCSLSSMSRTKFDAKMTKSKWNYTTNMIMNVLGTVCQLIHYFHGKQWLAIDSTWPALKVNNARGFDISWSFIYLVWWSTLTNYWKHFPQSICREFITPVGYFVFLLLMLWRGWGEQIFVKHFLIYSDFFCFSFFSFIFLIVYKAQWLNAY